MNVKAWLKKRPSVDEVRPARCPGCGAASRPVGLPLVLWGHGGRDRQLRGPVDPGTDPQVLVFSGRRYLCRACGAVAMAVPREVVSRRQFSGAAIALALALLGIGSQPAHEVRRRVSPWRNFAACKHEGWSTLRRWLTAIRQGRLWPQLGCSELSGSVRALAERVAQALIARAPVAQAEQPREHQAFHGAIHMA